MGVVLGRRGDHRRDLFRRRRGVGAQGLIRRLRGCMGYEGLGHENFSGTSHHLHLTLNKLQSSFGSDCSRTEVGRKGEEREKEREESNRFDIPLYYHIYHSDDNSYQLKPYRTASTTSSNHHRIIVPAFAFCLSRIPEQFLDSVDTRGTLSYFRPPPHLPPY